VEPDRHLCDLLILGGGLAGGLIALALAQNRPGLDVRIVDSGEDIGGNHIWSFFESDVAPKDRWLIAPLVEKRWSSHEVRFPDFTKVIDQPYCSITSERLDARVRAQLSPERILRGTVTGVARNGPPRHDPGNRDRHLLTYTVSLADGRVLNANQVIDVRGVGDLATLDLGYQKFVGQMFEVPLGHGVQRPIIMDATVDQSDGYRFVYCLPFSETEVFVEDTYYTNGPQLDVQAVSARIAAYVLTQGWEARARNRVETGVLPVVFGGDIAAYLASTGHDIPKAGVRAGLFHAMTGYSLPDAVRLATALPAMLDKNPRGVFFEWGLRRRARRHWRDQSYYRLLGKMLFRAAEPIDRYKIFQRFYKLSPALIGRFYSGQSSVGDKLRILMGKPPVPIFRALEALVRGR